MNVILLDNHENFIQYLDTELLQIEETDEEYGLRTIDVKYTIDDIDYAKKLFKNGHKLFIINDSVIDDDCLYVINDNIKEDYFKENQVTFTAEDILSELNYAPVITQNEITSANGFSIGTTNGESWVKVNYNALLYWFGDYFNIGIVQDCLSDTLSKISITGTMNRMSLLRHIEEETNNVFRTRYEKDVKTNVIHPYLDFLNPLSSRENWELNLEYDYIEEEEESGVYDENDNPISEDDLDLEDDEKEDVVFPDFTPPSNLDPETTIFRITDGEHQLNTNGEIYDETDLEQVKLAWSAYEVGLSNQSQHVVIKLTYKNKKLGVAINNKSFATIAEDTAGPDDRGFVTVENDPEEIVSVLPQKTYFEIFDSEAEKLLFQTKIQPNLGEIHEEVLDLTYNVENISFDIDESDTFSAITPLLSLKDSSDASNSLSRTDMGKIITAWKNLSVTKGETIPMILEKVSLTTAQKNALGTFNVHNNYFKRPYKPNDNIDSENSANSTFEYWRSVTYYTAPFSKKAGDLFVLNDTITESTYTEILGRPDTRDNRARFNNPKLGNVETSEEDPYAIYNAVIMKLIDKRDPSLELSVDVANYLNGKLNSYKVWDKVYVKVPGYERLVSARVKKTHKNPYDIGKNSIELGTYSINKKIAQKETVLLGDNMNLKYPNKGNLDITLTDEEDNKLSNKLVSFALYRLDENGSPTFSKTYNKKTNSNGVARLPVNLKPGNWEINVKFGGDILYASSSITCSINVTGTVQKQVTTKTDTNKKTVTATAKKTIIKSEETGYRTETKNYYYDKFGRSPDLKYICAIGLPSRSSELRRYGYKFLKTVFVNYCPVCKTWHTLYWGWNFGTYFRGRREGGSYEGHIFCEKCDADFSVIFGENHTSSGNPKLRTYQKPKWSSRTEANNLKKGKVLYKTETIKIPIVKVTSSKDRQIPSYVSGYVKRAALRLAGDSVGWAAAKKIAAYCGPKIHYSFYGNFNKSADAVLRSKRGNCCDQARLFLTLCAGAGCLEFLKLEYVYVCCNRSNGYGHVFARVTNKRDGGRVYVDPCKQNSWGHYVTSYGRPPGRRTTYPNRPF